jgi:hypothetical protein
MFSGIAVVPLCTSLRWPSRGLLRRGGPFQLCKNSPKPLEPKHLGACGSESNKKARKADNRCSAVEGVL